MLGPIPKVLGDTCYVRSNLGETFCNLVMLGPFMETIVTLRSILT